MASKSRASHIPENILDQSAEILFLGDILKSFDPDSYEKATTKYRKPSYQRGITKSKSWNISLVESVITGKAIGGLVISKWTSQKLDNDGQPYIDEFYNIEDGGTRLGALAKFTKGKFSTKYGDIKDPEVKEKFQYYKVPVVLLRKSKPTIRDSVYFHELCINFSLLQEGTALTASDRYSAMAADSEHNFIGSPIVNFTIRAVNLQRNFKKCCGLSDVGPRGDNRKKVANAVAIVSGSMFGPKYANTQYGHHIPILSRELSDINKSNCNLILHLCFQVILTCKKDFPTFHRERFAGYFNNPTKFLGLMIADVYNQYHVDQKIIANNEWGIYVKQFTKRWVFLINHWRKKLNNHDRKFADNWLDTTVYKDLEEANRRNSLESHLVKRMEAVKKWSQI